MRAHVWRKRKPRARCAFANCDQPRADHPATVLPTLPTPALTIITGHVWRPPHSTPDPSAARPCVYMTCGRPRSEHERAVTGQRTECFRGHRLDEANVRNVNGVRICRQCEAFRARSSKHSRKAAAA